MILGVLVRNELLKMFKRLAFWVTYVFFAGVVVINFAERYVRAGSDPDRPFALPGAWQRIVGTDPEIALFFGTIVLLLLIASEFSWRTARQNVIDGLSKSEWFAAKALLVPIVGVLFVGTVILAGGLLALLRTDLGALDTALVRREDFSAMLGFFTAFLGFGSLALFIALAVRSSGPAIGLWFLYIAVVEQLLGSAFRRIGGTLADVAGFLPLAAFERVAAFTLHDPEARRRAVEAAVQAGRAAPEPIDTRVAWTVAAGWIAVFVVGSFLWFRRRDL